MMGRRGKTVGRRTSNDAVVSDEAALHDLGVHNFIFPRLVFLFLMMRTNE